MTCWTIAFQSREYAHSVGDPNLGHVEAPTSAEAVRLAETDTEIVEARNRYYGGGMAALMAYIPRPKG